MPARVASAARPPSSASDVPEPQQDTERRARAERIDYKALHNGRPSAPPLRAKKELISDAMSKSCGSAPGPSTAADTRASAYAQRTAARERRLRAHPHADVCGPELVQCRLCGQHIKLSTKSAYDAFHWTKHIDRCARRAPALRLQRAERKKRSTTSKTAVQPPTKRTGLTIRLRGKRGGVSSSASASQSSAGSGRGDVFVKEESPDVDMQDLSSAHSPASSAHASSLGPHSSPPPETPPPPPKDARAPSPDVVLEDYYRRSRRRGTRELSPFTLEGARAWTWSQVKEAVWVVRSYPGSHDGSHDGDGLDEGGGLGDGCKEKVGVEEGEGEREKGNLADAGGCEAVHVEDA